ncbi:MAG: phytochelatin synthase [Gammaproteobacteria bacterium]|nr:phytochelatin synthase [Gammaproteobacteria bacterium]MCP5458729.1 phytochelatin synthase [Gammaproteobacteria bacterium]
MNSRRLFVVSVPAIAIIAIFVFVAWKVMAPPETVPVDSIAEKPYYQNPALLKRAWDLPVARRYKTDFQYQINAAFCGPATLINLLASLGDKGEYTQETIFEKSGVGYWKARILGLTLDEMAQLIQDNRPDLQVTVLRDLTLAEFRKLLPQTNDTRYRYLINFQRAPLFGVVVGHHSPIGGYLADQDLVFVLDVLSDYQPFLVPSERLFEAMNTVDSETKKKRGLLRVEMPQTSELHAGTEVKVSAW